MDKIRREDYMVAYDDEIGVVYACLKGKIGTTTPDHAREIEKCLNGYFAETMGDVECSTLEMILEKRFEKDAFLEFEDMPDFLSSNALRRIEIMTANDCNLDCKYCYAQGGCYGHRRARMTPESVMAYLNCLFDLKVDFIDQIMFFGGEPLICKDVIYEVCKCIEKMVLSKKLIKMPVFTMVTNGTLIDEEFARFAKRYDFRITVSIDGPKEIHDLLRPDIGGGGSYDRVHKGVACLKKCGIEPVLFEVTYTSLHERLGYTKDDIRRFLESEFNVDRILIANCEEHPSIKSQELSYDQGVNDKEYFKNKIGYRESKRRIVRGLRNRCIKDSSCDAGFGSIAMLPNGDLYPCHYFVNDQKYCLGKWINDKYSFMKYDDVKKRLLGVRKSKYSKCLDCSNKALCTICPASMLLLPDEKVHSLCKQEILRQKKNLLKVVKELHENHLMDNNKNIKKGGQYHAAGTTVE